MSRQRVIMLDIQRTVSYWVSRPLDLARGLDCGWIVGSGWLDGRTDGLHTGFYRLESLYVIGYLRSPAHSNWKSLVSLRPLSTLLPGVLLDRNELLVFKLSCTSMACTTVFISGAKV